MAPSLTDASISGPPRELLSGIDTLDLTCKAPAPHALLADLDALKAEAGEDQRRPVVFALGDDAFRVAASGMGAWWPYRLEEHRFGQLAVGESARTLPPGESAWPPKRCTWTAPLRQSGSGDAPSSR